MLFLWATSPKLLDALVAMGFDFKTTITWVNDKMGTGYYCRDMHELLLIEKKVDMPAPNEEDRPTSVIKALRQ